QVSPEADRAKATVQVKVHVMNPDGYLRPDMNATVAFFNDAKTQPTEAARRVIVVPQGVVRDGSVFVVVGGRAHKRPVTTSGTSDQGVLIASGLIGGEDVIVGAPANLKDGQKVEVRQQ